MRCSDSDTPQQHSTESMEEASGRDPTRFTGELERVYQFRTARWLSSTLLLQNVSHVEVPAVSSVVEIESSHSMRYAFSEFLVYRTEN